MSAGLLVTTVLGPSESVCVTVICRCRLLESRLGRVLSIENGRLITWTSLRVCPLCLPPLLRRRMVSGLTSRLVMSTWVPSVAVGLRKMIEMIWLTLTCLPVA